MAAPLLNILALMAVPLHCLLVVQITAVVPKPEASDSRKTPRAGPTTPVPMGPIRSYPVLMEDISARMPAKLPCQPAVKIHAVMALPEATDSRKTHHAKATSPVPMGPIRNIHATWGNISALMAVKLPSLLVVQMLAVMEKPVATCSR